MWPSLTRWMIQFQDPPNIFIFNVTGFLVKLNTSFLFGVIYLCVQLQTRHKFHTGRHVYSTSKRESQWKQTHMSITALSHQAFYLLVCALISRTWMVNGNVPDTCFAFVYLSENIPSRSVCFHHFRPESTTEWEYRNSWTIERTWKKPLYTYRRSWVDLASRQLRFRGNPRASLDGEGEVVFARLLRMTKELPLLGQKKVKIQSVKKILVRGAAT